MGHFSQLGQIIALAALVESSYVKDLINPQFPDWNGQANLRRKWVMTMDTSGVTGSRPLLKRHD